jgi:hypothetical protein
MNSGLANSSGVMGHYLLNQIYGVRVLASASEARDGKAPQGLMGGSVFIPRFRNLTKDSAISPKTINATSLRAIA